MSTEAKIKNLTKSPRGREVQRAHGQGRGQQSADKQQPEPGVDPEVAHESDKGIMMR